MAQNYNQNSGEENFNPSNPNGAAGFDPNQPNLNNTPNFDGGNYSGNLDPYSQGNANQEFIPPNGPNNTGNGQFYEQGATSQTYANQPNTPPFDSNTYNPYGSAQPSFNQPNNQPNPSLTNADPYQVDPFSSSGLPPDQNFNQYTNSPDQLQNNTLDNFSNVTPQPNNNANNFGADNFSNNLPQANSFDLNQDGEANFTPAGTDPKQANLGKKANNSKKSSNLIIYGGIALVVVLAVVSGILLYLSSNQKPSVKTQSVSSSLSSPVDSSVPIQSTPSSLPTQNSGDPQNNSGVNNLGTTITSAPANSPAALAKKNSATKLPITWLRQKFISPDVDAEGNCLNVIKCGENADPDNDGLTNIEEYNYGTDPLNPDTDNDGLSDGDEIYIYFTDPMKADSDVDTYTDGQELTSCTDPISILTSKIAAARLTQISSSASLKPIHQASILTLRAAGGASSDLIKGYIVSKCASSPDTSTPSQTSSSSIGTKSTGTSTSTSTSSATPTPTSVKANAV